MILKYPPASPYDLGPKNVSQGCHPCGRAGLGVERPTHLPSAKAIMENMT
jgi:hypothetical protein